MYEEKQMKNSKKLKDKEISEDDNKNFEKNIQKLTIEIQKAIEKLTDKEKTVPRT